MHQLLLAPEVDPSLRSYSFIVIMCLLQAPKGGKQEATRRWNHSLSLLISVTEDLIARDGFIINLAIDRKPIKMV